MTSRSGHLRIAAGGSWKPWLLPFNQPLQSRRRNICEPTSALAATSFALTTIGAVSSYSAQSAQASDQTNANNLNRQYIEANRASQTLQAQNQEQAVNKEAYQKLDQQGQQARAAAATATTAAGEAGVSGLSVDALQREYSARSGEYASQVEDNRTADVSRLQLQMQGFNVDAQAADNRLPVPNTPSWLSPALQIGGGALNAYDKYLKPPKDTGTP